MLPRNDDGTLQSYAWPGGYAIYYLDKQNSIICPDCANKSEQDPDEVPAFKPVSWGGVEPGRGEYATYCDGCGKEIC